MTSDRQPSPAVADALVEPHRHVVHALRDGLRDGRPAATADPALVAILQEMRDRLGRLPENDFGQGVDAALNAHRTRMVCHTGELGPEIPVPRPQNSREIGGGAEFAMFQPFMLDWFERLNPTKVATIDVLAVLTPEQVQAVVLGARRQVRRQVFRAIVRENILWAASLGGIVFAALQYGYKAWEALQPLLPAIQGLWRVAKTGGLP